MKFLKRIRARLNSFLSPQPGKTGSSMAFVMIIGAVLVIWVLAIMPLMVAVGNNSLLTQGSYADYLQSRSAIEFCKGELENIVETKPPYTFCVVKNGNEYTAIPKMDSITLSDQYDKAINRDPDATDVNDINDNVDTDDVPKNTAEGNSVVAICAVSQDNNAENVYHITITTYNNGKKNLTYTADYTIRGSLLINPESYLKSQALPLSDFVVVDGRLGAEDIWYSNIRNLDDDDFSTVTDLSQITESLLSYEPDKLPGGGRADSGVFPSVFKVPVLPAVGPANGGGNASEPLTTNDWTILNPVSANKGAKNNGDVWYKVEQIGYGYDKYNAIIVYLRSGSEDIRITDYCKIYLNGVEHTNGKYNPLPTSGIYTVSIDMTGYGKFLPVKGLQMLDLYAKSGTYEYISDPDDLEIGQKYLLLNNYDYAMYHQADGTLKSYPIDVNQVQSNEYYWTLEKDGNGYYLKASNGDYLNITRNSVSLSDDKTSLTITDNGNALTVSRYASNNWRYLRVRNGNIQKSDSKQNVYFCKQSTATYSFVYGTSKDAIKSQINASDLKVNGTPIDNDTLNAGTYLLTGKVSGKEISLGKLIIEKATSLSADTISLSFTVDEDDPQKITVSASGIDEYGGVCYIGYAEKNSGNYHWFPADNGSYTFRLDYGHYDLAVCDSGTLNQSQATKTLGYHLSRADNAITFENGYQSSMMMGSSLYFMGRGGSIDTKGNSIHLTTDLLVMRHGILGDGSVYIYPYSSEQNYDKSDADTLFFPVNDMKNAAGFQFKSRTFYWIPAGTDINYATEADLNFENRPPLSLDNDADYDRLKILLRKGDYPEINMDIAYIDRENNADKVNAETGEPSNEQLAHIVSGETIGWTVDGKLDDTSTRLATNSKENSKYVICAYVTSVNNSDIDLMANRILIAAAEVSSNGVKSRTLSIPNSLTLECRYFSVYADLIQQASASAEFTIENLIRDQSDWDRIFDILDLTDYSSKSLQIDFELSTTVEHYQARFDPPIAAQIYRIDESSWNVFSAFNPKPLTVTYTNSELYNLIYNGRNIDNLLDGHFSWGDIGTIISNLSEIANVSVRVVDRYISLAGGSRAFLNIAAYKNCKIEFYTNYIFIANDVEGYSLSKFDLGPFSGNGIADLIINSQERGYASEYLGFFTTNSVETYNGTIICIARDDDQYDYGYYKDANGNYYQDANGNKVANGGITVNGTFIPSGFYFIPAKDGGTSITALTDLGAEKNQLGKPWAIKPEDLPKYSIYIKEDGTLSDAYVDTGLIGNGDLGESGFSGGNVG